MSDKLTPAKVRVLLDRATKGPWRVNGRKDKKGGSAYVCVSGWGWTGFSRVWVRMEGASEDITEGNANADLITSAPDLAAAYLEAVAVIEGLIGPHDESGDGLAAETAARAFLAKHKEQSA